MISPRLAALLVLCGIAASGCRDLERFDTKRGEAYCGTLVAPTESSEGFDFAGNPVVPLSLALTLDTDSLENHPGRLRSNDAGFGPCKPRALFEDAPLRILRKALGDRISSLHLGDDHEDDLLAYVDSTCSGSMVAVLSLMQNGQVELRLLRPAPERPTSDATQQARFGVFALSRQKTKNSPTCDF